MWAKWRRDSRACHERLGSRRRSPAGDIDDAFMSKCLFALSAGSTRDVIDSRRLRLRCYELTRWHRRRMATLIDGTYALRSSALMAIAGSVLIGSPARAGAHECCEAA